MTIYSFLRVFVVVLLALTLVGCWGKDSNLAEVSGIVTLDGKPYEGVSLTFRPEGGGRPGVGKTGSDGRYTVHYTMSDSGAPIGVHRVTVTRMEYPNPDSGEGIETVPERFREFEFEVLPGQMNEFNVSIIRE